jgi:hypothetical protein
MTKRATMMRRTTLNSGMKALERKTKRRKNLKRKTSIQRKNLMVMPTKSLRSRVWTGMKWNKRQRPRTGSVQLGRCLNNRPVEHVDREESADVVTMAGVTGSVDREPALVVAMAGIKGRVDREAALVVAMAGVKGSVDVENLSVQVVQILLMC